MVVLLAYAHVLHALTSPEPTGTIQKLAVLLVSGITTLSRPLCFPTPFPTSAIENPNAPIVTPLSPHLPLLTFSPRGSHPGTVASLSSHAPFPCMPNRAPGDANHIHSVLNTYFRPLLVSRRRKEVCEGTSLVCSFLRIYFVLFLELTSH